MSNQYELAESPKDAISSVKFSPTGTYLAVASWESCIYSYQRSSDESQPYKHHRTYACEAPVLDIAWGKDDSSLFVVGLDHDVTTINTETGERHTLSSHGEASNKVAYSEKHGIVISTSWDGTLHAHDPETNFYIRVSLQAKPFALSLTADRAVVAMAERKVSIYDIMALKKIIEQTRETSDMQQILEIEPWQQRESSLKFMTRAVSCMPDGTGFSTSSIEGRVGVEWFDPELEKKTYAFKCHRKTSTTANEDGEAEPVDIVYPVNSLAFHPVHGTFATGGGDGVVALWDAQTKRRVRQYKELGASIAAMDFSSDGAFLAIGVCPGFEDGNEEEHPDPSSIKVIVRELSENETKGKPKTDK